MDMYKFTPDKTTTTPSVQMEEDDGPQSVSSPAKVNQQSQEQKSMFGQGFCYVTRVT